MGVWLEQVHELDLGADRRYRRAAADGLAEAGEVGGDAEGGHDRLDGQRVSRTVIALGGMSDLRATGEHAGHSYGAQGRVGPRGEEAHFVDRGRPIREQASHAATRAPLGAANLRRQVHLPQNLVPDVVVAVSGDEHPVADPKVQVTVSVHVPQPGTLAPLDHDG